MRRFVVQRNINRYRDLLRSEINDERRCMLRALLAEEEGKLAALDAPPEDRAEPSAEQPKPERHDRLHRKPS